MRPRRRAIDLASRSSFPVERVRAQSVPPSRASHGDHRVIGRASQRAPARVSARDDALARCRARRRRRRERQVRKTASTFRAHGPPARMDRGHRARAMALARSTRRARALRAVSVVPSASRVVFRRCGDEGRDDAGTGRGADGERPKATRRRRSKGERAGETDPSRRAPDV